MAAVHEGLVQKIASAVSLRHVEHGHDDDGPELHEVIERISGSLSSSVAESEIK